ncbi:MAG TPA: amidohydrolase family protein [Edaphobacter sp.]|nr:amidohydrolase family protein [Edaphobacter sp.]
MNHDHTRLSRRTFLAGSAFLASGFARTQQAPIPIIDTHIHFFDTTRPQGVPYPGPTKGPRNLPIADPETYRKVATPFGVVGAIEVEASNWIEDNLWVLEVSQKDPMIVGTVGNLEPDKPEFREYLGRYHKNPLFRGIRYGSIWGRNLDAQVENPAFVAGIKDLAAADLTLDIVLTGPSTIETMVRLTDKVPTLRVVLDHLPNLTPPTQPAELHAHERNLRELARRNVYVKVSEVVQWVDGKVPTDLAFYKPRLDMIWDIFGEDRLLFGSDWPQTPGNWVSMATVISIVHDYFFEKGRPAAEKYFWKNSLAAYKWVKRDASQPSM